MKTVTRAFLISLALCASVFSGCSSDPSERVTYADKKVEKIARVFWHEGTKYSVLVEGKDNVYTIAALETGCDWRENNVQIIADLKPEDQMWVLGRLKTHTRGDGHVYHECFERLDIHVHSPKDIGGGMWDEQVGKSRRTGQTSVIQ